jgi:hypothetical protein
MAGSSAMCSVEASTSNGASDLKKRDVESHEERDDQLPVVTCAGHCGGDGCG